MKENANISYKFKAECAADAQTARAVLLPWLLDWQETRDNLILEEALYAMPGVVVAFSVQENLISFGEMLWLLDGIDNCHVVADTLELAEKFTGERKFRDQFEHPAQYPRKEVIERAIISVRTRQQILNLELERALELHRTYLNASRLGSKWTRPPSDAPRPGHIFVLKHQGTGLISIHAVKAKTNGKGQPKKNDASVDNRLLTLAA